MRNHNRYQFRVQKAKAAQCNKALERAGFGPGNMRPGDGNGNKPWCCVVSGDKWMRLFMAAAEAIGATKQSIGKKPLPHKHAHIKPKAKGSK